MCAEYDVCLRPKHVPCLSASYGVCLSVPQVICLRPKVVCCLSLSSASHVTYLSIENDVCLRTWRVLGFGFGMPSVFDPA